MCTYTRWLPVLLCVWAGIPIHAGELQIVRVELGKPVPAIPFYHVKASVALPRPSFMEAEMAVNGRTLRFLDLYRGDEAEDIRRPPMTHRPPSGFGLSHDNTVYKTPTIVGWVNWLPGHRYTVTLTVRLKKSLGTGGEVEVLTASETLTGPPRDTLFDNEWKNYKSVVVSETGGIDRTGEAVEVLLPFYPDEAKDLKREVRVAAVDPVTFSHTEIAVQVFDIQEYLKEDDLAPDDAGRPTRTIPIWLPTVTARVAFLADVPARTSKVFLVYYNNEKAVAPLYRTDLRMYGEAPGLRIENNAIEVVLHPNSGHLDQLTLKALPRHLLFHRKETNGAIHWTPELYAPPRPWTHTSDWKPAPHSSSLSGPVLAQTAVWGSLREIPEVDASVRYEFFPNRPYFLSTTSVRINETVHCLALRNAEMVFAREMMTHAAWYDVISDSVVEYDVQHMTDLTDLKMEADVPWITFFNRETGLGIAGIQVDYSNAGLENSPRLLNPYFYVTAGPWIYWARALSLSFLASNMQHMIPVPKGNFFTEQWAYLLYRIDEGDKPFHQIEYWRKALLHPLRVQLVEEVDDRVSRTVTELYIDKGRSGWEGRETAKHPQ